MRPTQSISDLLKIIKGESSIWISQKGFLKTKFSWQEGYGAFSYAKSQVPHVINYIKNQKEQHRKQTFIQEYVAFLEAFEIDFDEQYIFDSVL
jgi:REP element-mobilizing transposase RayT